MGTPEEPPPTSLTRQGLEASGSCTVSGGRSCEVPLNFQEAEGVVQKEGRKRPARVRRSCDDDQLAIQMRNLRVLA
jgi:hypothetical protein